MSTLATRLQLPEAVGLSLSVIAPTVTAAFYIIPRRRRSNPSSPG